MDHRLPAVALVLGSVALFTPSCNKLKVAHSGDNPVYPLRGKHDAVPCVGCHGDGRPKAESTVCMDCHEEARPSADHYPGQDCVGCHIEDGWQFVDDPYLPTGPTGPTGDTGPDIPEPTFDHSGFPETQLCWGNCHEDDRPDDYHYKDPKADPTQWWDCSGCHTATAWDWEPIVHPTRLPHGTTEQIPGSGGDCNIRPEGQWLTGCSGCHPDAGVQDYSSYVCFSCHNEDEGKGDLVHGGTYEENACQGCHVNSESEECNTFL